MAAWVLNLDADRELAAPETYAPRESVIAAMKPFVARLAETLLDRDDLLVDAATPPNAARGQVGRAWSPTPRALAVLARAGAEVAEHPPLDVLRRVTSRAFSASLGPTLPAAALVDAEAEALAKLSEAPPVGNGWRLKRAFGLAGREHRIVDAGKTTTADAGFVRAAIAEGGLVIEPNVVIVREYAMHGFITSTTTSLGALVVQRT